MNSKLAKRLRKVANTLELPNRKYEQSMGGQINVKETERGFYRHLKRNAKQLTA